MLIVKDENGDWWTIADDRKQGENPEHPDFEALTTLHASQLLEACHEAGWGMIWLIGIDPTTRLIDPTRARLEAGERLKSFEVL